MLHPPQLIANARMLYLVWTPADPDAAARLLPDELTAAESCPVFLNQYVVDDAAQTSNAAEPDGFGAYSLTYLGVDLAGLDTEAGVPGRWWTHYFDSSENMIRYATAQGVPASAGTTTLELDRRPPGGDESRGRTAGHPDDRARRDRVAAARHRPAPLHHPAVR